VEKIVAESFVALAFSDRPLARKRLSSGAKPWRFRAA
jgi:hypothetical protein